MWRVLHWLFGWHYVQYTNCIDDRMVRRVKFTLAGRPYINVYMEMQFLDQLGPEDHIDHLTWVGNAALPKAAEKP